MNTVIKVHMSLWSVKDNTYTSMIDCNSITELMILLFNGYAGLTQSQQYVIKTKEEWLNEYVYDDDVNYTLGYNHNIKYIIQKNCIDSDLIEPIYVITEPNTGINTTFR